MVKHLRLTRKKVEKSRSTKLVFAFWGWTKNSCFSCILSPMFTPQLWCAWNIIIRAEGKPIIQCLCPPYMNGNQTNMYPRREEIGQYFCVGQLFTRALDGLGFLRASGPKLRVPLINKRDHSVPGPCCLWERF
jgi:hypothetical protein